MTRASSGRTGRYVSNSLANFGKCDRGFETAIRRKAHTQFRVAGEGGGAKVKNVLIAMTYRSPALLLGFGGLVGHRDQHVLDLDGSPAFYLGATLSFDLGRVIGPSRWGLAPRQWARRCDSPAARETPPAHDPIRTTAQAQGKACEHKKTQGCHKGEYFTLEVFATKKK